MNFSCDDLEKAWCVKAIIEKEYFKAHSIEDLATLVGTNKCTLNCLFHQITQMPVKHYLLWFRMEKAKDLLTNTNYSIKQIATKVGISRRNFERQFKKLVRITPSEWRNKEQLEDKFAMQDVM
jgi:two-component system response regulator YesN